MFNSSQKQAFIASLEGDSKAKATTLFNNTEPFEESKGRDLAEFGRNELTTLVGELIYNTDSARRMVLRIKAYGQWVHNDAAWMADFSVDDVDIPGAMQKFLWGGADDVESTLQLIDEPWSILIPSIILLWYGMPLNEIISLKKDRCIIQQDIAVFSSQKRTIIVSDHRFVSRLYTYSNCIDVRCRKGPAYVSLHYVPSDYFIRVYAHASAIDSGKVKPVADARQISNSLFFFSKKNGLEIGTKTILTSGRLHRLATTYPDAAQSRKAVAEEFEADSRNIIGRISDVEYYRAAFLK